MTQKNDVYTYEFIFVPNNGFLNSQKPLPPKSEIKLTFDRSSAESAVLKVGEDTSLLGKKFKIKNVYLQASFISSPYLRSYFSRIEQTPIKYKYEDCSVICRNISAGQQMIRLDNVYGGIFIQLVQFQYSI